MLTFNGPEAWEYFYLFSLLWHWIGNSWLSRNLQTTFQSWCCSRHSDRVSAPGAAVAKVLTRCTKPCQDCVGLFCFSGEKNHCCHGFGTLAEGWETGLSLWITSVWAGLWCALTAPDNCRNIRFLSVFGLALMDRTNSQRQCSSAFYLTPCRVFLKVQTLSSRLSSRFSFYPKETECVERKKHSLSFSCGHNVDDSSWKSPCQKERYALIFFFFKLVGNAVLNIHKISP